LARIVEALDSVSSEILDCVNSHISNGLKNLPFDHGFEPKKWARVHFIPDLKVGVFVTLRAPDVIISLHYVDYFINGLNVSSVF